MAAKVLTEFVMSDALAKGVTLELHCLPAENETDWPTFKAMKEILRLIAPLIEGDIAAEEVKVKKAEVKNTAVMLKGKTVRLVCLFRKCFWSDTRLAVDDVVGGRRLALHDRKLVACAAALGEDDAEVMHKIIGAQYEQDKISHYFKA